MSFLWCPSECAQVAKTKTQIDKSEKTKLENRWSENDDRVASLDPNEVNTDNLENTEEGAKVADGFDENMMVSYSRE